MAINNISSIFHDSSLFMLHYSSLDQLILLVSML